MDEALPWKASCYETDISSDDYEIIPWFSSREDIEKDSPSRRDGIDLQHETFLRRRYCAFLDLVGKVLKVPQVTIATAKVYCHRFFFRQSHAKNDKLMIATVCMLLAGKVEETPVPLNRAIVAYYGVVHKNDISGLRRKEVYEHHKELVLSGEKLVLSTLNFELYIRHPYRPLARAIKKYTVEDTVAQLAWDFVNDSLRTTLCLQYKPHHIAAGALFHAFKNRTLGLQSYGEVFCREFDITACQLQDIRGQILELTDNRGRAAVVHQPVSRDMASTSQGGSRPEGIGEEKSESEAGKIQDSRWPVYIPMDEALPWKAFGDEGDVSSEARNIHDNEIVPWFSSREDIEKDSPSRRDGIDLETETHLRKSYCTFLEYLGKKMKIPQVTIATAIVFCHRFFVRQSHAKNNRVTIAAGCMLLAGKVEDTPVFLDHVVIAYYWTLQKKEVSGKISVSSIPKEEYLQHKEHVLSGEKLVLSTLNFELYIRHPYRPLARAIKKYMVEDATAKLAWDIVNNCLRTTLCLLYKPHHIAAGALFLASELRTVGSQSYGEVLCQEFDITLSQLEDIRGQIFELLDKKLIPPTSQESVAEKSGSAAVVQQQPVSRDMASTSHGGSRPEGIGEEKPESEAGKNQDDHSVRTKIVETTSSDDVGIRQLDKDITKMDLMDEKNTTDDNTSVEQTDK